jgi:hypothetical protein
MRIRLSTSLYLLTLLASGSVALASPAAPPISGLVSNQDAPVADALVICYNIADTTLSRSRTAADGTFVVISEPVGVYDVVAYKKGFFPALVRLWHQAYPDAVSAVRLQLSPRGPASRASRQSSLWELRDRLPADVLREISLEDESVAATGPLDRVRVDRALAGEVRSVTNVSSTDNALSRTAVGVHGGLPNGWQYDLHGDYSAVTAASGADVATRTGNAAGLALDLATAPDEKLTVDTRRHTLSMHDDSPASLQTHGVSWSHSNETGNVESVAARYVEETNLYRTTSAGGSFFPIGSRTLEVKARYARAATDTPGLNVSMTYRYREGLVGPSGVGADGAFFQSAPDADLAATSSVRVGSSTELEGGVIGRYLSGGYGLAPVLAARYDVGGGTFVFVRGLYRVAESGTGTATVLPLVTSIEENGEATSRKGFSAGVERRTDGAGFRAEVSNQRVNEAVRAFFEGDFLTDFDSLYLFDGNTVRQYQLTASHRLTDTLSGSVAMRYGTVSGDVAPLSASGFGVTDNAGRYWSARAAVEVVPTHTGVAVLVRGVRQRLGSAGAPHANDADKVAVSLAQDLSILGISPFGSACKLLLALESARSTAYSDSDEQRLSRRLLGGLAFAF